MDIQIRRVTPADEEQWTVLYSGYRAFYEMGHDPHAVRTTWSWVSSGQHGFIGLVATVGATLVGLANLRAFARPSNATVGLYLDDLFTSSDTRGQGVGTALLHEAAAIAARDGASVIRWITAEDNAVARRLYDQVATATKWITYDMDPAPEVH